MGYFQGKYPILPPPTTLNIATTMPIVDNQIVILNGTHGFSEATHVFREWLFGEKFGNWGKGCRFVRGKHQTNKTFL